MKTRMGYVSNSSSSSFILNDSHGLDQLTRGDIEDALKSRMKCYDEYVREHREAYDRGEYEGFEEAVMMAPFIVYDLSDREQRSQAMLDWGEVVDYFDGGVELMELHNAKFLIHFDDNFVYNVEGMYDDGEQWESDSGTQERFTEILAKSLVEMGRLPLDYDWRGLRNSILGSCMHEG